MKQILIVALIGVCSVAQAQKSETRNVGSFTGISVAEGVEVYLTKGQKESVKVEIEGGNVDEVITDVSGSYLKVHMRSGRYNRVDVTVHVTYVTLKKVHASSAGRVYSRNTIDAEALDVSASSAGNVELTVNAREVKVSASTAGEVEIEGRTGRLVADVATAGEIDADELEADHVEVEATTAGSARVFATQSIEAKAYTGGSIRYRGNPDKQNNISGTGGTIKRAN